MAAMHGLDLITTHTLLTGGVILQHRVIKRILEQPVTYHIAREEGSGGGLPGSGAAR